MRPWGATLLFFLIAANVRAEPVIIDSETGDFLGTIRPDARDETSIFNPNSKYASPHFPDGLNNPASDNFSPHLFGLCPIIIRSGPTDFQGAFDEGVMNSLTIKRMRLYNELLEQKVRAAKEQKFCEN